MDSNRSDEIKLTDEHRRLMAIENNHKSQQARAEKKAHVRQLLTDPVTLRTREDVQAMIERVAGLILSGEAPPGLGSNMARLIDHAKPMAEWERFKKLHNELIDYVVKRCPDLEGVKHEILEKAE